MLNWLIIRCRPIDYRKTKQTKQRANLTFCRRLLAVVMIQQLLQEQGRPATETHAPGYRQKPPTTNPPRSTPFRVNSLRFTVNVVTEKDRSTVHDVVYVHDAAEEVMMYSIY